MIQPHPEEQGWQAKRSKESEEKKLFALHSENQRLQTQQYEFEVIITDYAHKIDSFNEKSRKLEQQNQELRLEVENLNSKNKKVEDTLSRRNEEYCALYNYLFTEKRGSLQEAFLKEVDLSNRLNEIQHESDSQIISKLRETIKSKNEELLKYSQRISSLNQAIITSSFEYQEKINVLKNENLKLKQNNPSPLPNLNTLENINEYCLNKKIESLTKQIGLYQSQLFSITKQLSFTKKSHSQIEKEKLLVETELRVIKSHLSTFDGSIYDIISENSLLKQQLASEKLKIYELQRNHPEFKSRPEEFNRFLGIKQAQIKRNKDKDRFKEEISNRNKQLETLKKQHKQSMQAKENAQKKYESLKIVSTSAFQKLKEVIATYVPYYFRRGGLENYNLQKEEQEFLNQRNVQKTLQAAYQEINAKITQANQLKQKQIETDRKITQQTQKIEKLERDLTHKENEIVRLSKSVQCLMQTKQKQQNANSIRYSYEGYEQEELNQIVNEDEEQDSQCLPLEESMEKGYHIKVDILEKAIQEFQADRSQLVEILKKKDIIIAELTAELNVLSNTSHFRPLIMQPFAPNVINPASQNNEPRQQDNQEEILNQRSLNQIRQQLQKLSTDYQLEKQLIIKEYEQRQTHNLNKYLTLLKQYNDLTAKCNALEAAAPNNSIPEAHSQDQNLQQASELPLELPETHHQPQRDQAAISESAIQSLTDALKKYEKEFNRFVSIYEAQIKKSMENSMISEPHESEGESQLHSEDPVEKLQSLITQHNETIKHLQGLLEEKNSQAQIIVARLESSLREAKEETAATAQRLQSAQESINDLKSRILSEKNGQDFTSSESANTAFLILNAKNKQIDELKAAHEKLKRLYEDKSKEAAKLQQLDGSVSRVDAEEYRIFRQIMEEQNLLGVLEEVVRRLE